MRFVLNLGLVALLSTPALAAPWDIVPLAKTQNKTSTPIRPVQIQRGGSSNNLQTIKELNLNIAATGLGQISAVALGEDGTLYTADARTGRLWALTDQGQDGKIDMRRPLPHTFEAPTGLAVIGNSLYVADHKAVWVIKDGNPPRELASLRHANSTSGPHILIPNPDGTSLTLGLTTQSHNHRILDIDALSGRASLIHEGSGRLQALAQQLGSEIWTASGTNIKALSTEGLGFKTGQSITSIALPGQFKKPRHWPERLKGHIIAAQSGVGAMRLITIPTEFGTPSGTARILVDGFLVQSGRSAWGEPGAIVIDARGLFFADIENGNLWHLSSAPKMQPKITIVDTDSLPANIRPEPSLASKGALKIESSITGTQIDTKSSIIKPSSIEYGSKLIKDYNEIKALEAAEKADEAPKKKRRMSRKRKQPDN